MLEDPLGIDRRLREVAAVRSRFRQKLRRGTAPDHAFEHVGERVSAELLDELRSQGADDPLGAALYRFAYVLHEEHALAGLDQSLAEAWHTEKHPLEQPFKGSFTLAELRAQALADRRGARGFLWTAFVARAERAGELALRRWEERAEHAARLRVPSLDALEGVTSAFAEAPLALLEATAEPFAALGVRDASGLVTLALGEDSAAEWPSRLSGRSLAGFFEEPAWFRHVTPELDTLVPTLGAASFMRGLRELGRALRKIFVQTKLPFVLEHDPFELEVSIWGALFALLPFGESFATRRLGVAKARLGDHRRVLSRVLLISAREAAVRALLRGPALQGMGSARRAFQEVAERAFGIELPARAAGALFCPEPASMHRFAALALATELEARLTQTHDEDWYRNPRAVVELRECAALAPETSGTPERLASGVATLARRLLV